MAVTVDIRRGSVYLPAAVVDTYFAGIDNVIVIIRDGAVLVLPVHHAAAGGCLLKIRNAAGDRVAITPDVFAAHDLADFTAADLPAQWSATDGALRVPLP